MDGLTPDTHPRKFRGFTLIEILVVVLILGILASVVIASVWKTQEETQAKVTFSELKKVRRHLEAYYIFARGRYPTISAGDGTWGEIVSPEFLSAPPVNAWVGGANSRVIIIGTNPDTAYQTTHGWIYDPATGRVWAGGYDSNDEPFPR